MTQKLQQLQQAIREVCAELKELAWGCEAHIRKGNCLNKYVINCTHRDTDGTKRYKVCCLDDKLFNPEDFTEIIGHPIELQHILRAIEEHNTGIYYVESGGGIVSVNCLFRDTIVDYDLTLPLDQQSPEVIDFLNSIICKEEAVEAVDWLGKVVEG